MLMTRFQTVSSAGGGSIRVATLHRCEMTSSDDLKLDKSQVVEIATWAEFEARMRDDKLQGWAFRGQSSAKWHVESALSRRLRGYGVNEAAWPIQERRILSLF